MLYTPKVFKTVVHTREGATMRVCTGESITKFSDDDFKFGDKVPEEVIPITKRNSVTLQVRTSLIISWVLTVLMFVGFCWFFYQFVVECAASGKSIFQCSALTQIGVGVCGALFVLDFRQCLNPVVHDSAGHWVNLRNGSTNLCGGTRINRKPRWP